MSQETVMRFFEAVRKDEAVSERLRAVSENIDEFARLSADLGRERGFAFGPSDVRETLDALSRQNPGKLSDRELSAVAGGGALSYSDFCSGNRGGGGSAGCTEFVLSPRYHWAYVNTQWVRKV